MSSNPIPVLIVGGGPVGLALACDLGRRGVQAVLVERRGDEPLPAKMLEVGVRTMEFCRQLGVTDDVKRGPFDPSYPLDNAFVTNLRGYELGRVEIPCAAAETDTSLSPERMRVCPQTWFDPILKKHASGFPSISLRERVRLDSFVQDREGVTASLTDLTTGAAMVVRASYLVGCDGFGSTVRDLLQIAVRGEQNVEWSVSAYVEIDDLHRYHHTRPAFRYVFVGVEGTWGYITLVDGKRLWRLTIGGRDRERLEQTDVAKLLRRGFGCEVPFVLRSKSLWVRRRTVADRFCDGRVFLAGDAAHAHPPNGGLGMNTGIQDAFDLGWKLTAMIEGWGGEGLLASYDIERRPACARATEASLINYHRLAAGSKDAELESEGPAGEAARARVGRLLVEENKKAWHPMGVHLGYVYSPSPIIVPDGAPPPKDDLVTYTPTSYPGARAPHAWIDAKTSVLDLFGIGFVLLNFSGTDTSELDAAARTSRVPLRTVELRSKPIADLYERAMVLVRPDGHVAWRGDAVPADPCALLDTLRGAGPVIAARRSSRTALASGDATMAESSSAIFRAIA